MHEHPWKVFVPGMLDYPEKCLSRGLCVMNDSLSRDKLNPDTQPQYALCLSGNIFPENDPLGILHVLPRYANLKNFAIRAMSLSLASKPRI